MLGARFGTHVVDTGNELLKLLAHGIHLRIAEHGGGKALTGRGSVAVEIAAPRFDFGKRAGKCGVLVDKPARRGGDRRAFSPRRAAIS